MAKSLIEELPCIVLTKCQTLCEPDNGLIVRSISGKVLKISLFVNYLLIYY